MPLKSSPEYRTVCRARPSCEQIARISSMSKPLAAPSAMRSNGGSGKAEATISVPGLKVMAAIRLAASRFFAEAAGDRNRAGCRRVGGARPLFGRFPQRAGIDPVVELRPLPLRAEQPLLDRALLGCADHVAGRAQVAQAREIDVDHGGAGDRALEQDLLGCRHHGKPALGMV